jgi:hypothetical protein
MDRRFAGSMGRTTGTAAMNWTTDKPTKPGWYWYRGECDGHTVKVIHFIDDDGNGPYLATSEDLALNDLDGEWAGPVEPPLQGQSR